MLTCLARARPMPLEPPVIRAVAPLTGKGPYLIWSAAGTGTSQCTVHSGELVRRRSGQATPLSVHVHGAAAVVELSCSGQQRFPAACSPDNCQAFSA